MNGLYRELDPYTGANDLHRARGGTTDSHSRNRHALIGIESNV